MKYLGGPRHEVARKLLYSFFGDNLPGVLDVLGLPHGSKPNIDELSSGQGGSAMGAANAGAPLPSSLRRPGARDRKKYANVQEISNNSIIGDIMSLIISKGIQK